MAQAPALPGPRLEWQHWLDLRSTTLKEIEFLLTSPNPEVVLSALDLYMAAYSAVQEREWPSHRGRNSRKQTPEREQALIEATKRVLAASARTRAPADARACIIRCLHDFFQDRHALDGQSDAGLRYDYLRRLLAQLRSFDVVITFNWDALAERVLAGLNLWTPVDGYGLDLRRLRRADGPISGASHSAVKVLKLHGSVGWYADPDRRRSQILIDGFVFLKQLGFECDNEPFHVLNAAHDTDYPSHLRRYWDHPLIVYPTFLKTIAGAEFGKLWQQATVALSQADQVDIYGYSLPASDGAGRVLLNHLRSRLGPRGPLVHVHDPAPAARKNWREFLGRYVRITADRLG